MLNIDFRNSTDPIDGHDVALAINEQPMITVHYTDPKTKKNKKIGLVIFRAGATKAEGDVEIKITGETIHKLARRHVPASVKDIEILSHIG